MGEGCGKTINWDRIVF